MNFILMERFACAQKDHGERTFEGTPETWGQEYIRGAVEIDPCYHSIFGEVGQQIAHCLTQEEKLIEVRAPFSAVTTEALSGTFACPANSNMLKTDAASQVVERSPHGDVQTCPVDSSMAPDAQAKEDVQHQMQVVRGQSADQEVLSKVRTEIELRRQSQGSREFLELQHQLENFCQERGLVFVPPGNKMGLPLRQFQKEKWHARRKKKIEEVRQKLEGEFKKIDALAAVGQRICECSAGEKSALWEDIEDIRSTLMYPEFMASPLAEFERLLSSMRAEGSGQAEGVPKGGRTIASRESGYNKGELLRGESYANSVKFFTERMKMSLRYGLEAWEGTYCSGRFQVEFLAELLGYSAVEGIFLDSDGKRKRWADLGCGDGDLLIGLARAYRRLERGSDFLLTLSSVSKKQTIETSLLKKVKEQFLAFLELEGFYFDKGQEPIDPHFVGLDLAEPFLDRLQSGRFGILGRQADLCSPFKQFSKQSGLRKNSIDIAASILTLDRVPDSDAFLQNLSAILSPQGQFLLGTKSTIQPSSDGRGARELPISYGRDTSLTSRTRTGMLEKLLNKLKQHGLRVQRISCHPYKVISTDCHTKGPQSGPQTYNLVLLSGDKL